jgi:hypothetical protein
MKPLSSLSLDEIGYAPSRPKPGAVAQHLRAFLESAAQLLQLFEQQPRFASSPSSFEQRLGPLLSPGLMPPTDRLAVDPQLSGRFALTEATVKESGRFESSPFQAIEIAFNAFWIAHARTIAPALKDVTILYEHQ